VECVAKKAETVRAGREGLWRVVGVNMKKVLNETNEGKFAEKRAETERTNVGHARKGMK
jgi:hypothetical protein